MKDLKDAVFVGGAVVAFCTAAVLIVRVLPRMEAHRTISARIGLGCIGVISALAVGVIGLGLTPVGSWWVLPILMAVSIGWMTFGNLVLRALFHLLLRR